MVIERVNSHTVTEANLLQQAVGSILSKESGKLFTKLIRALNVETKPFEEGIAKDEHTLERLLPKGYEKE